MYFLKFLKRYSLIVLIITLIAISFLLFIYSFNQQSYTEDSNTTATSTCMVEDSTSLKKCIKNLLGYSQIYINSLITCNDSTECNFIIEGKTNLSIVGSDQGGFLRNNKFDYEIFNISNSTDIKINNLLFQDEADTGCDPLKDSLCKPFILINNSPKTLINKSTFIGSKRNAITISSTLSFADFSITNSTFKDSNAHSILNYNTLDDGYADISNNEFVNNASNAIALSLPSITSKISRIVDNTFIHNHHTSIYFTCGINSNEACGGGQLYIQKGTKNMRVSGNLFSDGYLNENSSANPNIGVFGIEIDNTNVSNLLIEENIFVNNDTALGTNCEPFTGNNSSNISITDNLFNDNSLHDIYFCPPNLPTNIDIQNNTSE